VSDTLNQRQKELIEKVAEHVVRWHAAVPAIFFLESMKPLSFVGSQFLLVLGPIAQVFVNYSDYEEFVVAMERRENVELLLQRIEDLDSKAKEAEKAARRQARELRRRAKEQRRARKHRASKTGGTV